MSDGDSWDNLSEGEEFEFNGFDAMIGQCRGGPDLPKELRDRLRAVIDDLEKDTGNQFQIRVEQFGVSYGPNFSLVGDFEKRGPIEVNQTEASHEAMTGKYESIDDLRNRIKELHYEQVFEATKEIKVKGERKRIGKCKQCHSYNDHTVPNYVTINCCQGCGVHLISSWSHVDVDVPRGSIYRTSGGTVDICEPIGSFVFV